MDPIQQFKENAKQGWSTFTPTEMTTGSVAPYLVKFADIKEGMKVLDVACGTGVVALTAARLGARVSGIDLTPALIARAQENASMMKLSVAFCESDAEALPFEDAEFDVVVSQFGHMFAPRPDVVTKEMLRVLKPGGRLAFSTWPPELLTGKVFALGGKYLPKPPAGVSPPSQWGDPHIIRERLGSAVRDIEFDRGSMFFQFISVQHHRAFMEQSVGPIMMLVRSLETSDPQKLSAFRQEYEDIVAVYFKDNQVRQDFLMTRAIKV